MRTIYLWSLSLLLLCFSGASNAANYDWWSPNLGFSGPSPMSVCIAMNSGSSTGMTFVMGSNGIDGTCLYNGVSYNGYVQRRGTSCPAGQTYSTTTGVCSAPVDPCASKSGTASTWQKTYPSYSAYSPIYETTSQGGCGMTVGTMECGSSASGEFSCWGTGTYTGTSLAEQEGGGVQDCTENCSPPDPKTTTNDQQCTANGSGGFTCTTSGSSSEFSSSECTVGSVGGATGYVCTKPDYVPEASSNVKTDNTTVTQNPDGTTTTTTTTTSDNTYCSGSGCTTTTTTTTGSTTTDADGNVLGKTEECTGPNCPGPKDETEEEEEVERTASGTDCSSSLACEGDAIDCAVLEQQKLMRCSLDWDTQKGAVIAEAGKAEYELQTQEVDAASFFTGPGAARWLTPSCPADKVLQLATTGTSITISWSYVCEYATAMGNLLVALASLFFAVYVGRAFGG